MGAGVAGLKPVLVTEWASGLVLEWHKDPTGGLRCEFEASGLGSRSGRKAMLVWRPRGVRWSWGIGRVNAPGGIVMLERYGRGFGALKRAVEAAEQSAAMFGYIVGSDYRKAVHRDGGG